MLPALLTWRRSGDDEMAALAGALSARVVDDVQGAPELLAFGADLAALRSVDELAARADALERRHTRLATLNGVIIQLCLAAAVTAVLALGVDAVHDAHGGPGHGRGATAGRARHLRGSAGSAMSPWHAR